MSLFSIFNVAGSGMSAESVRLNTTASNLANVNSISSSAGETYKARHPIFSTALSSALSNQSSAQGVQVQGIVESNKPLEAQYNPDHPMANEEGYVYKPNVNVMEEIANMISASQSYQTQVQVSETSKKMLMNTLQMGK